MKLLMMVSQIGVHNTYVSMNIKRLIYVLRAIRLGGIVRTIQYSLLRDRIEQRYSTQSSIVNTVYPGDIQQVTPILSGARLNFDHASVEIIFLSQNLIKISWEPGKSPVPYTIDKFDWEIQQPIIKTDKNGCSLSCGKLVISIGKKGGICYQDNLLNVLRKDEQPVRVGDNWHLDTILKPEEHIYGLGERAASLNLRPGNYCSWNIDVKGSYSHGTDPLYIGTPIYLSLSNSGSHLVYFENSFYSKFVLGEKFKTSFDGGMLRYYLIFGSLETIFEQLSALIGRPFMPPRWALGYHQSRWGYKSEVDIREVIEGFKEHDLPLSAVHLDIDYMDGYRIFTINPDRYPDMKRFTAELEDKGVKLVVTINPAVKNDRKYQVYVDGLGKNTYCRLPNGEILRGVSWAGWSVFPDFSNPEARNWWVEQYKVLFNMGISGIWHDMNEPTSFTAWRDVTFPSVTNHYLDGQYGDHLEAHNLYALLMNSAGYESFRKYVPDKRPWIFSRAGWASLQRYAWNWTGDIETSWESLKQTIPTILGLGLSGHAFSGVDIGGFSGDPEPELYLRWFQLATFLPLFRTHSAIGTKPREPWVFGDPTTSIIRNFLKLRYKLLPYLYTLAWETSLNGIPPLRPLFWEDPKDPSLWDIDDEFLFGESLLIAPVLSKGLQTRHITLPPGRWYSFWDDHSYNGPIRFESELSPDTIPVFIKGGTVLPIEENGVISLNIYPKDSNSSLSHIYSDAGDGYDAWRLDTFRSSYQENSLVINWESVGDYKFPYSKVNVVSHGKKLIQATADNSLLSIHKNTIIVPIFRALTLKFE